VSRSDLSFYISPPIGDPAASPRLHIARSSSKGRFPIVAKYLSQHLKLVHLSDGMLHDDSMRRFGPPDQSCAPQPLVVDRLELGV
jgi:hypothetical protein